MEDNLDTWEYTSEEDKELVAALDRAEDEMANRAAKLSADWCNPRAKKLYTKAVRTLWLSRMMTSGELIQMGRDIGRGDDREAIIKRYAVSKRGYPRVTELYVSLAICSARFNPDWED